VSDSAARGLSQVNVELMDAAAPDLPPASFDVLASSLVLFFLPDPALALANWHDLLVPGGRIGISTFGRQDPAWAAVDDVFTPYLPPQLIDARTSGRTGPFGSDQGVESLFRAAGFTQVRTTRRSMPVAFRDAAHWQEWTWSHGQRAHWEAVPAESRDDVLAIAGRALEAARDPSGTITFTQDIRYTLGRRPAAGVHEDDEV
jgi:SAM-dependent methyltransferase